MQKGDGQYQCQFKLECNNSVTSCNVCTEEVKLPPALSLKVKADTTQWGGAGKVARESQDPGRAKSEWRNKAIKHEERGEMACDQKGARQGINYRTPVRISANLTNVFQYWI